MVCLFTSALNIVSNVSSKHEINKYKNWENLIYYFAKYINEADGGEGFPQLIPEGSHTWLGHWYAAIHNEFTKSSYKEIHKFIFSPKREIIAIELFEAAPMHLQKSFIQYCKNIALYKQMTGEFFEDGFVSDASTDSEDLPELEPNVPNVPENTNFEIPTNNNIKLEISWPKFNFGTINLNNIMEETDLKKKYEMIFETPLQSAV
tara:strand:+ start:216 stop:830 length:615 start_codon:yes stop_codon:yes gene_type:complete